jgi:hypothetical protein
MAAFIIHPVGSSAPLYTLYWLIPAVISLSGCSSVFLRSLASTFVAHAIGSIIWLHTHTITADMWNGLIGVVWAERMLFALSMTAVYYGITSIHNVYNSYTEHNKLSADQKVV